jgi:hypothetical protein
VSFIMAVWEPNTDWLRTAVASVLAERDVAIELIVVDDGSAMRVSDLLADVGDVRVRHVPDPSTSEVPHHGVSAARNAGLAAARGRFVRYVDSDDAIVPGSTAHLLDLRGDSDDDRLVTVGGIVFCDSELRPQWTLGGRVKGDMFEAVLRGRFEAYVPSLLIPLGLLQTTGPWDVTLPLCEDLDFMFRLAEHAHARGDGRPAYLYRRHPHSASATPWAAVSGKDAWLAVYERHYARHPEHRNTKVERWLRTAYVMDQVLLHWGRREARPLVRTLARALSLSPADAWYHARAAVRYRRMTRRAN